MGHFSLNNSGVSPEEARVPAHVAIIDDHRLLAASLAAALEVRGFTVDAPNLADAKSVRASLEQQPPSIALLDLDLGDFGSGEDLLPVLVDLGARVLIVSGNTDEALIGRCLSAGAWGWVPKSVDLDRLLDAVLAAAAGRAVMDDLERDRLLRVWRERHAERNRLLEPFERLSRREGEVLTDLQRGHTVEQIAARSFVSETTVRTQVRAILTKLGVNSQLEAVAKATEAGWKPASR